MASVTRYEGESFEGMMRRFRKTVQDDRLRTEMRRRRYFEKPSIERKRRAARKLRKSRRNTARALRLY